MVEVSLLISGLLIAVNNVVASLLLRRGCVVSLVPIVVNSVAAHNVLDVLIVLNKILVLRVVGTLDVWCENYLIVSRSNEFLDFFNNDLFLTAVLLFFFDQF